MLNRRVLRVKAMQALFAYQRSKEAGVSLAEDEIATTFEEEIHNTLLEEQKPIHDRLKFVKEVFRGQYHHTPPKPEGIEHEADINSFQHGVAFYNNHLRSERIRYKRLMLDEIESIFSNYLMLLRLPVELAGFVTKDRQRKQSLPNKVSENKAAFNLEDNVFVKAITGSRAMNLSVDKYKVSWKDHTDHIITWYKDILKTNPDYLSYQNKHQPGVEDDLQLIRVLYRDIVFGNEVLTSFFEEQDMWWTENKGILKNMVKKTIKGLQLDAEDKIELVQLLVNEEDDMDFFKHLFDITLDNEEEFETVIGEKAENWDKERVSAVDKIILKMAMSEFLNFPSIPVKVTINEYIELSKNYSTPKSKQFVNGILDNLSEEWISSGKIKKSGRGLMDNK